MSQHRQVVIRPVPLSRNGLLSYPHILQRPFVLDLGVG
jgi:hypothetical protein